jgi:hypothetical protein
LSPQFFYTFPSATFYEKSTIRHTFPLVLEDPLNLADVEAGQPIVEEDAAVQLDAEGDRDARGRKRKADDVDQGGKKVGGRGKALFNRLQAAQGGADKRDSAPRTNKRRLATQAPPEPTLPQ